MTRHRILFLVSAMIEGGAERVAALLCNKWVEDGHEVTLMPTFSGRGECLYPLDARVKLDYLADRIGTTRKTLWTAARRFLALRQAMREIAPDAVVSFLTHVNVAALLAATGLGIPVIVSERSMPARDRANMPMRLLRSRTYRRAHWVVAQTRDTAQWIKAHCPGSRVTVIPNPVTWPLPEGNPALDPHGVVADGRRLLLAAGRLVAEKGFDLLIAAFSDAARQYPQWDLAILGEGPERATLERQSRDLKLSNRVLLPGRIGNVGDWYARADLFALSSHFEGFPNVLVEAMASGVAAVARDCLAGPRDIVRHAVDGLLVSPEAGAGGFSRALSVLMGDDMLREHMGERARDVRNRFSLAKVSDQWAEIFDKA